MHAQCNAVTVTLPPWPQFVPNVQTVKPLHRNTLAYTCDGCRCVFCCGEEICPTPILHCLSTFGKLLVCVWFVNIGSMCCCKHCCLHELYLTMIYFWETLASLKKNWSINFFYLDFIFFGSVIDWKITFIHFHNTIYDLWLCDRQCFFPEPDIWTEKEGFIE